MIEQPLADGRRRPGDRPRDAGREGARPARLHDRPAPRRRRRAVRRRTGDGAEAGADLPRARRDRSRARAAGCGDADVAAGAAVHAGGGGAAERAARTSCCCAAATKASTSGCASASTEELSIGDYVLTGGELPALVVVDAVARLVPGVVGDEQSVAEDSFSARAARFPARTRGRPEIRRATGAVPDVLLSGNHAEIRRWRQARGAAPDAGTAAGSAGRRGAGRRRTADSCCGSLRKERDDGRD